MSFEDLFVGDTETYLTFDPSQVAKRDTDGNARVICRDCNLVKNDASLEQLKAVAAWMTLTPDEMRERAQTYPTLNFTLNNWDGRRQLLSMKKYAAKKAGVLFNLTFDDVVWSTHCPVFGVPFELPGQGRTRKGPQRLSLSFDRIDQTRGYEPGNVVLVSHLANSIMGNALTPDAVRQVAAWVEKESLALAVAAE